MYSKISVSHMLMTERLRTADAVLVDKDGCLIAGGQPLPGAIELIELLGERMVLVSNNSSHSARGVSDWLQTIGLRIPHRRILLAGELAVRMTRKKTAGAAAMILASAEIRAYAAEQGLDHCDDKPACVLLCRDINFNYECLKKAIHHLSRGVPLVVANPDLAHPDAEGNPVPETGALLAVLQTTLPGLKYEVAGKPQPAMFQTALKQLNACAKNSFMIGDNPETDGKGAGKVGIRSLLIGFSDQAIAKNIAELLTQRITL